MTVETQVTKVSANGNDVATVFSFSPLVIFDTGDIVVTHVDVSDVETVLSEGSSSTTYSVSTILTTGSTGSITYPAVGGTPLATGERIIIKRVLTLEQLTDLENQGGYNPETQETQYDKLLMIDLQQQEEIDRALKVSIADDSGADFTFPGPGAGKFFRWNAGGTAIELVTLSTAVVMSDDDPEDVSLSAATSGVSTDASRKDHVHLLPTVSVAKGGTGAVTAGAARTNLAVPGLAGTNTFTGTQLGTITTLSDGASITPDFSVTNDFTVTLAGNRTLENPTNQAADQWGAIRVVQDATGSRTLAYGTHWNWIGGAAPVLTTTANAVDVITYWVYASGTIYATIAQDFS